jgi:pilus assembly protein CpaE
MTRIFPMATNSQTSEQMVQAVFSVCAAPDVSATTLTAVESVPGAEFIGEFKEYITAERRPEFSQAIKNAMGVVALIDCDSDHDLALETMERLQQTFLHKVSLVAVASRTDAPFLLRAMRAGCSDFLSKPINAGELAAALTRFQSTHLTAAHAVQSRGKLIAFYGVKGGVGNTTLAVHLAIHLVRKHHKRVLLIDHKHELGHVALHLGIKESAYFFEGLIRNSERLDSDLLEGLVTKHPTGLEVIPSADSCSLPHEATPTQIERVMEDLKKQYDFVLVDSTMQYHSAVAPMLAASDVVALVATPDVAALRDLARHIEHLSLANNFTGKLRVIINRSNSDDAVPGSEIEKAVRFPVTLSVPNNFSELARAVNAGEPIPPQSRGAFTQAIARWAHTLAAAGAPSAQSTEDKEKKKFSFWR